MGNQVSSPVGEIDEKQAERRRRISEEIFTTEQTYVLSLAVVTELYLMPLMQSLKTPKPLLTEAEVKAIFSDMNHIFDFHLRILKPEIHARVEKWSPSQCVGDVFVKHSDMFKIYTQYVNNYDSVYERFENLMKRKEFKAFVMEAKSSPRHTQLDLMAYLIMPIQRIPRYVMLLSDLLKHTDPVHPDYKNLQQAVSKVESVARYINEKKREDENMKRLVSISKSIEGNFDSPLVQPHRKFVREGALELVKVLLRVPTQGAPIVKEPEKKAFSFFRKKDKTSKEGFLMKEGDTEEGAFGMVLSLGGMIKSWKKRWFVLDGTKLSYYLEQVTGQEATPQEPRGVVDLAHAKLLTEEEKKSAKISPEHLAIWVSSNFTLVIEEKDEKNRKDWADCIQNGIELAKKTSPGTPTTPTSPTASSRMSVVPGAEFIDGSKSLGLPHGKYYVFLFSDLVVQCVDKGSKNYRLKGSHRISDTHKVIKVSDDVFSFEMEEAVLHFKDTPSNVDAWVAAIQKLIADMIEDRKNRQAFEEKPPSLWQSVGNFFS